MNTDKRFAGSLGAAYDIFYEAVPWHDEFQNTVPAVLKEHSNISIKLIEAGFGTGITTKKVLEQTNVEIYAIDSEPQMLFKAKEYIGDELVRRVHFQIGDLLLELGRLPDNSFDGFYSGYVLHNIPHVIRKNVFKEIGRVLKPGAVFINADKIAYDNAKKQHEELAFQLARLNVFLEKYNDYEYYLEWVKHYLRDEEEDLIFREKEQIALLQENGFVNIHQKFRKAMESVYVASK